MCLPAPTRPCFLPPPKQNSLSIVQEAQALSVHNPCPTAGMLLEGREEPVLSLVEEALKMHLDLRFNFLQHILKCQKDKWCSLLNVSALNSLKKISLSFILRVTGVFTPTLHSRH